MTADERIEKLLNRFGQTISDLPKPEQGIFVYAYSNKDLSEAQTTANKWCTGIAYMAGTNALDYICHLEDVIDRMETALQTASERIDDIRETASCMAENCRPWEDRYDSGCDEACTEIVKLIDGYSVYEEGEVNDSRREN